MNNENKKDEINELIEKSGNNFHYKVVNFLRKKEKEGEKEWQVLVSPYYNDNISDKPREIDIIAEKKISIGDFLPLGILGILKVQLFIECKYINKPTIFWFDKRDEEKARLKISNEINKASDYLIVNHHYCSNDSVAKLFTSAYDKSLDTEPIYKAISQSLNAMIYYRDINIFPEKQDKSLEPLETKTIRYPLIICNSFDNIYMVDSTNNATYSKINEDSFQLEVNYAYLDKNKNNRTEYFLIDVIDFNKLESFLTKLEQKDINNIARHFKSLWEESY